MTPSDSCHAARLATAPAEVVAQTYLAFGATVMTLRIPARAITCG